jgi:uncharacterized membrane protein
MSIDPNSSLTTLQRAADRWSTFASLAILLLLFVVLPRVGGIVSLLVWAVVLLLLVLPVVDLSRKLRSRR